MRSKFPPHNLEGSKPSRPACGLGGLFRVRIPYSAPAPKSAKSLCRKGGIAAGDSFSLCWIRRVLYRRCAFAVCGGAWFVSVRARRYRHRTVTGITESA